MGQFQKSVNVYNALGVVGSLAFSGPIRASGANIYSNGTPNNFGYAYTWSSAGSPDPAGAAPNGQTAQVGGTGIFAGILINPKENVLNGTTGNPLGATLALADYSVGDLLTMGYCFVNLPGPANPGDLVTYDPLTGALNSIPPAVAFTGSIAAGGSAGVPDVLTVSAIASGGAIEVGAPVTGVGVEGGTFILSLGTGLGGTGTYNLSTINQQTVASRAMTAGGLPAPAFAASSAYITTSAGVDTLHITTLTSGELAVGQQIFGTGMPANVSITAFGTGVGGTGTYILNTSGLTLFSVGAPGAITGPSNLLIPHCVVERYAANTAGGTAVIKLTN